MTKATKKMVLLPACLLAAMLICSAEMHPVFAGGYEDLKEQAEEFIKAFDENRFKDATVSLQKLTELLTNYQPTYRDYIREAYFWEQKGQTIPASTALEKALKLNKKAAEVYFLRALLALRKGAELSARENLRHALDLKPLYDNPVSKNWYFNAAKELWKLFSNTGEYGLAVQEFQELAKKDAKNSQFLFYLGYAQLFLNSNEEAAESFLKGLDLRPDDSELHELCMQALKKTKGGLKGAIDRYQQLFEKHAEADVQLWLGVLYVEDGQKDKALPLLLEIRHRRLGLNPRYKLAEVLAKADQHEEAAGQYGRVLKEFFSGMNEGARVRATMGYGKELVLCGRLDEGIQQLYQALTLHRTYFPNQQQPLHILFELGDAHWRAKRKSEAEIYFREYLRELEKSTPTQQRLPEDVKIAEHLGELYQEDKQFAKAAAAFQLAFDTYKVLREEYKAKYPGSLLQFKLIKALHDAAAWDKLIPVAKDLVGDKDNGPLVRQMLARAYFENDQTDKALEQLGHLKGTGAWNEESMVLMGQVLLAYNKPDDALQYIEEAFQKHQNDERITLLYAQALATKGQVKEAGDLYEQILRGNKRARAAWIGSGDLEMQLAKAGDSAGHLAKALKHYKEAKDLHSDLLVQAKINQAERELAVTKAELRARSERFGLALYTGGLFLAALIPIGLFWFGYRRHWAARCFQEVCHLERDLTHLIRRRVESRWLGDWSRLTEEPFRGRVDYRSLRNRADKEGVKDLLGVANFGHLVGIIDAGWEALGFGELCAVELVNPKEVIIANLSYVSSCRVCLAHVGKLEELTGRQAGRADGAQGVGKAHLSQHLHRQVRQSLRTIRAKFRITLEPVPLPVLVPVAPGSEHISRSKQQLG